MVWTAHHPHTQFDCCTIWPEKDEQLFARFISLRRQSMRCSIMFTYWRKGIVSIKDRIQTLCLILRRLDCNVRSIIVRPITFSTSQTESSETSLISLPRPPSATNGEHQHRNRLFTFAMNMIITQTRPLMESQMEATRSASAYILKTVMTSLPNSAWHLESELSHQNGLDYGFSYHDATFFCFATGPWLILSSSYISCVPSLLDLTLAILVSMQTRVYQTLAS